MIYCLCGASGTGKTTLLNYIRDNFNIDVLEVSARPYLPKDKDYVKSSNETNQILITQNRYIDITNAIMQAKPTVFSRSPIDSLAYEYALNICDSIIPLLERQIDSTYEFIEYIYLPIEFKMEYDEVRGNDEEMRENVDNQIINIFNRFKINYHILKGDVKQRCIQLDEILKEWK